MKYSEESSGWEKCGFLLHILSIVAGCVYYYNLLFMTTKTILLHNDADTAAANTTTPKIIPNDDFNVHFSSSGSNNNIYPTIFISLSWSLITPTLLICWFFSLPLLYGTVSALFETPSGIVSIETIYDDFQLLQQRDSFCQASQNSKTKEIESVPCTKDCIPEIIDYDVSFINDIIVRDLKQRKESLLVHN